MSGWELVLHPSARRTMRRLPEKIAAAVAEFLLGPLSENPHRVGKKLSMGLEGYMSARVGMYRVVYRISEEDGTIFVVRIDHRVDIYRIP